MDNSWILILVALVVAFGVYSMIKKAVVLGIVLIVAGFLLWPTLETLIS